MESAKTWVVDDDGCPSLCEAMLRAARYDRLAALLGPDHHEVTP